MKPVVGFPSRRALLLASATLLIALAASVAYTAYDLTKPSEVIGIAAEKHIGHGTDHRGDPVTTYTVSLALVTPDGKNHMDIGGTLAYIVEKDIFDQVFDGMVIKGRSRDGLTLEVLALIPAEVFRSFEPGDNRFSRDEY